MRSGWPCQSSGIKIRRRSGWPVILIPNMSHSSRSCQSAPRKTPVTLGITGSSPGRRTFSRKLLTLLRFRNWYTTLKRGSAGQSS